MLLNKILVDYNPIALVFKKILQKSQLLGDIANYFRTLIGSAMPPFIEKLLFGIGVFSLTSFTIKKIYDTYKMWGWIIPHYHNIKKYHKNQFQQRYGKCWVIITGFTEGIGWQFTLQFARLNFNLILAGIEKQRMQQRLQYLNEYYPNIKVQMIEANATIDEDYKKLKEQINKMSKEQDIGILINNIGIACGGNFLQTDKQGVMNTLKVNSRFTIQFTQDMLPILRNRKNQKYRSGIINMCSCTGVFICPWLGAYSITKSFLDIYTRTIALENKDKIDIMTTRPFGVTTRMMKMRRDGIMITPIECVQSILYDFIQTNITFGAFKHKLAAAYVSSMTEQQMFLMYKNAWGK